MKTCTKCKLNKSKDSFHRNKRRKDGLSNHCKACRTEYDRDQYQNNSEQRARRRASVDAYKLKYRLWYYSLKNGPCVDCKQVWHPYSMHWDHTENKTFGISQALAKGYSKQKVLNEIAKCELVCANCHAIRTYERIYGEMQTFLLDK